MFVVVVRVHVVADRVADFIAATLANAAGTRREPGNLRFDVLQQNEDPTRFTLYEVYHDEAGFKAHQGTPHYLTWKAQVADMMASPRVGEKHHNLFPEPWA
jgi:autoinducer 2-degrading protein